jgi:predicted nuclease of predicted toxin-antitoxin system
LLKALGFDIKAVAETTFKGHEDDEIVALAEAENRVVITHDVGFGSIYYFSKRGQVGIIIIRIHPPTLEEVNPILIDFLTKVNLEEKKLTKSLIVLNKKKYRILK